MSDEEVITVKVLWSQSNEEVEFKLKKKTPFERVKKALAQRFAVAADSFSMQFDGKRISNESTPKMLEMEDGDQIDAMLEQTGGRH
jgi:small ubiquitin-related modifier